MSRQLTVYVRDGCHLCEDMLTDLRQYQAEMGFELETVEIDDQVELESRYGTLVPVLVCEGQEICHYFLDEVALKQCFGAA